MYLLNMLNTRLTLPDAAQALPGRAEAIATAETHAVSGRPLKGPHDPAWRLATFGMGCFWGAERLFWQTPGVMVTMVGFMGGHTPNPTSQEVGTGLTAHAEVVRLLYDPARIAYDRLLALFFENHDPTEGMKQGNDIGTAYRSMIFCEGTEDLAQAEAAKARYGAALAARGLRAITTEVRPAMPFYFAEAHQQQYLARNPTGSCSLKGTGIACPAG